MKALADIGTLPSRERLSTALVLDAWRGITTAQLRAAFTFGLAAYFYHVIVWLHGMLARPSLLPPLVATFIHDQVGAFLLLLAAVVADRLADPRSSNRAVYAWAVVVSAAISASVSSLIALSIVEVGPTTRGMIDSTVYTFCEWVILSGAAVFVYTDRRRARAARDRLHAAELARTDAARRTLESQLQAMQARVEPRFLFNTLAQVRELYRENAGLGASMLDAFIAYLRAAMPTMRETTSTVEREATLVQAWVDVARQRIGAPIRFCVDLSSDASPQPLPAMMLLPLVERTIAHGGRSLHLRATAIEGTMRIAIAGPGIASLAGSEELAAVHERLRALYGSEASCDLFSGTGDMEEITLAVPAPSGSR